MTPVDLLTVSAEELSSLLDSKVLTTEGLVEDYFAQIDRHNHDGMNIRAVISAAPRESTLQLARQLDKEREEIGARGPLHGIPVLVKDVFFTPSLGMPTTLGSAAFIDAIAPRDADIVSRLLKAGAIIIGKANLSELGAMKGEGLKAGWSVTGGQTQSPYVRGGITPNATMLGHSTPAGSSAGSAAGIAAGFAALGVSTETDGSTVQPATRAALYGLKATLGSAPTWGSQPITPIFDSIGGMAKTPSDLANLMEVLQEKRYAEFLTKSWEGLKIGFVDPALWQPAPFVVEPVPEFTAQSNEAFASAVERIRGKGAKVVENVPLITLPEVFENGVEGVFDTDSLMDGDMRRAFGDFLAEFEGFEIKTLADLVKWNEDHAEVELPPEAPSQSYLIDALNNKMTQETFNAGVEHMRRRSREKILQTLGEFDVDVILGPADARMASVAACAGYPIATVPLGFAEFNGRAFGLNIIAPSNAEGKILQVMSAWEGTIPEGRAPPPLLVNWTSGDSQSPHP
ncbi:amidase signature enzyme [Lindgomyces ingoldianus]|uniref:Amidase signature enzyme n=1 Tax=Lindgomyces ingoldianus TaxID=673940 RepID=A0ACB6QSW0_9PLEO|nr:amidase signature enzyme [Lindgomyces ingoldianus]KAF2469965.1 amidase signature enzyme [Lindgomyces ingoldianus]